MILSITDVALLCYLSNDCDPNRVGPLIGWAIIVGFMLFVIGVYHVSPDRSDDE